MAHDHDEGEHYEYQTCKEPTCNKRFYSEDGKIYCGIPCRNKSNTRRRQLEKNAILNHEITKVMIHVNWSHIKHARKGVCKECAIAIAIRQALFNKYLFYADVIVGKVSVHFNTVTHFPLPKKAIDFIAAFDYNPDLVIPIQFCLNIPTPEFEKIQEKYKDREVI